MDDEVFREVTVELLLVHFKLTGLTVSIVQNFELAYSRLTLKLLVYSYTPTKLANFIWAMCNRNGFYPFRVLNTQPVKS